MKLGIPDQSGETNPRFPTPFLANRSGLYPWLVPIACTMRHPLCKQSLRHNDGIQSGQPIRDNCAASLAFGLTGIRLHK
jgi:hypothetical protein